MFWNRTRKDEMFCTDLL